MSLYLQPPPTTANAQANANASSSRQRERGDRRRLRTRSFSAAARVSSMTQNGRHATDWPVGDNYQDIAAVSSSDVWIVGQSDFDSRGKATDTPLVARWDGKRWRVRHTPIEHYTHVSLYGVSAVSTDGIWAVGNHLIARFHQPGADTLRAFGPRRLAGADLGFVRGTRPGSDR